MGNPYQGRHAPTGLAENFTWAVARVVMAEMPDDGLTCAWGLAMRISPWWRWNRLPSSRPESSASAGPPSDRAGGAALFSDGCSPCCPPGQALALVLLSVAARRRVSSRGPQQQRHAGACQQLRSGRRFGRKLWRRPCSGIHDEQQRPGIQADQHRC